MTQRRKTAVPPPRTGKRGTGFLIGMGLVFAAGVGFAVGYTMGKKSSGMQPLQLVGSKEKPKPSQPPPPRRPEPPAHVDIKVASHTPIKGNRGAPVTIVEFSDFQ